MVRLYTGCHIKITWFTEPTPDATALRMSIRPELPIARGKVREQRQQVSHATSFEQTVPTGLDNADSI